MSLQTTEPCSNIGSQGELKIPEQKPEEKANSSPLLFGSSSPERIREKRESQRRIEEMSGLSEPYFENNKLFIDPKDNHGILNKDERNLEDIDMRRNSMPTISKNKSSLDINRRISSPLL